MEDSILCREQDGDGRSLDIPQEISDQNLYSQEQDGTSLNTPREEDLQNPCNAQDRESVIIEHRLEVDAPDCSIEQRTESLEFQLEIDVNIPGTGRLDDTDIEDQQEVGDLNRYGLEERDGNLSDHDMEEQEDESLSDHTIEDSLSEHNVEDQEDTHSTEEQEDGSLSDHIIDEQEDRSLIDNSLEEEEDSLSEPNVENQEDRGPSDLQEQEDTSSDIIIEDDNYPSRASSPEIEVLEVRKSTTRITVDLTGDDDEQMDTDAPVVCDVSICVWLSKF